MFHVIDTIIDEIKDSLPTEMVHFLISEKLFVNFLSSYILFKNLLDQYFGKLIKFSREMITFHVATAMLV